MELYLTLKKKLLRHEQTKTNGGYFLKIIKFSFMYAVKDNNT